MVFYLGCLILYFGMRAFMFLRTGQATWLIQDVAPYINNIMLLLPYMFYFRFSRYFIGMQELMPALNKSIKRNISY